MLDSHELEGWSVLPGRRNILNPTDIQAIYDFLAALSTIIGEAKNNDITRVEEAMSCKSKLSKGEVGEFFDGSLVDAIEETRNDLKPETPS